MKTIIKSVLSAIFFSICYTNSVFSQHITFDWIKVLESYSGSNPNIYTIDTQIDNDNNIIATGHFSSTALFGLNTLNSYGGRDIFIAKFNPQGTVVWLKHYGGVNNDQPSSVAISETDDIYVSGTYQGTCNFDDFMVSTTYYSEQFLVKINPAGVTQWVKSYKSDGSSSKIVVEANSNLYYCGKINNYIIFGEHTLTADGSNDLFIAELTQSGEFINGLVVNATYGLSLNDVKYSAGNLYLTGYFEGSMDFSGNIITSAGNADIFIANYGPGIVLEWAKQAGGYYDDHGESIILRNNDLVISGNFSSDCYFSETEYVTSTGVLDAFIAAYDLSGNFKWANFLGSPANEYNNYVADDSSGIIYLTGSSRGKIEKDGYSYEPITFENDIYLARFGPNGDFHWLTGFIGIGHDYARRFKQYSGNKLLLIGSFQNGIYLNDTITTATMGNDEGNFITVFDDTILQNDLAVCYMSKPDPVIIFEPNKQVTVKVQNLGSNPQYNIPISYTVNNSVPVINIIPSLAPYQTISYTFDQPVDMTEIGEYDFRFDVELLDDEDPSNNILNDTSFSIAVPTASIHWGSADDPLNGLTISWTNTYAWNKCDSIQWGYTDEYLEGTFLPTKVNLTNSNLYHYEFPPLISDSVIHYSVYNHYWDLWSTDKTFSTSVTTETDSFSFYVAGNTQNHTNEWKTVADRMNDDTDFGIFLGDIASQYGEWQYVWEDWMEKGENFTSKKPVYHTFGDDDGGNSNYENVLILPHASSNSQRYYSFEYGNAVFICLNSNGEFPEQQEWLVNTLEANSDKMWKFVYFHHLFFSCGGHQHEIDYLFDTWWQAFDDYGVDMILNGQAHNYQRTKPINRNIDIENPVAEYGSNPDQGRCQINLGGAGAVIEGVLPDNWSETADADYHYGKFEIHDNLLRFVVKDTTGQMIDSFVHIKYLPGNILGDNDSICLGSSTGTLSLENYRGTIINWQKRFEGGEWTDIENNTNTYEEIPLEIGLWEYRTQIINYDSTLYAVPFQIRTLNEPISDFSFIVSDSVVQFTNASENAISYLWDFDDGNVSIEESPVHLYSSSGVYNVQLIASNYVCLNDTSVSEVLIQSTEGIETINQSISVFPNPVYDYIHIRSAEPLKNLLIRMYDLSGKLVIEQCFDKTDQANLSVKTMEKGCYMLEVISMDTHFNKLILLK